MSTRIHVEHECGFEGVYSSEARASYALARHSCERHRRIAARQANGRALRAAVDRAPKPCLHKEANHQHGTYSCYVQDYCRCPPCARANADYELNRTRQQAYGRWNGLVDAEAAREHIRFLTDQGMGLKRIVAVSGVSQGLLWKLMYGKRQTDGSRVPSRRIRPDTAARILAVQLDLADGARVDSTGAVRRIQALVALGWSQMKLSDRLDINRTNFTPIAQGRRREITVAHDRAVRALYNELSMQLPPNERHRDKISVSRTRKYAKTHGWLPPLAWDDETLDAPDPALFEVADADEYLDEAAIYRRMHGDKAVKLTVAEKAEVVRRLVQAGCSKNEIERRTGLNPFRYELAS